MAQSLYREWFVKFRFPGHEQTKFIDSPQGKIPEGWGVAKLEDYVVLQRGFDLPKKIRASDGGIPVYAATGFNGFHNESKVKAPGLVTGRSGSLGKVTFILDDFWPLNTTLWGKYFGKTGPYYACYLLRNIGLESFNSGAAVPTLNRNSIHGLPILDPPKSLLQEFESFVEGSFKSIHSLRAMESETKARKPR